MAVRLVIAIGILAAFVGRAAQAEPSVIERGVSDMLRSGQRDSQRVLADARKQHEKLSALPDYDARAEYAFAVVLIRQRSTDEALAALDRVLAERPDLLPACARKSGCRFPPTGTLRPSAACVARPSACPTMARNRPTPTNGTETARFFGRMFDYLENRPSLGIAAHELRKSKQFVQSRLGNDRAQFSAGEETMSAQFVKSSEQLQQTEAATTAHFAEQEAAVRQQLKKVDKAEADVDFKSEKLQTDTKGRPTSCRSAPTRSKQTLRGASPDQLPRSGDCRAANADHAAKRGNETGRPLCRRRCARRGDPNTQPVAIRTATVDRSAFDIGDGARCTTGSVGRRRRSSRLRCWPTGLKPPPS